MRMIEIGKNENNQRLDRILGHYFNAGSKGFIYKMLRKKNITLNDKKAEGNEKVYTGDIIKLWFSEESLEKLSKDIVRDSRMSGAAYDFKSMIVYEDDEMLVIDKPQGLLSQKVEKNDISVNDLLISYMLESGQISSLNLKTFKPSICNRLDRNTSGLLICGKSLESLRRLNKHISERKIKKYYLAVVSGEKTIQSETSAWLYKDKKTNKVIVRPYEFEGGSPIKTKYEFIRESGELSLVKIELITGKTHQIRAYLSSLGMPILGDCKYGNPGMNQKYRVKKQMLFSYELVFENGLKINAPFPDAFKKYFGEV